MCSSKRKQPRENPLAFKGEFSFVNKDASNISSKEHNGAVSWHVVNRYERWKKQEQAKRSQQRTSSPTTKSSSRATPSSSVSPRPSTGRHRRPSLNPTYAHTQDLIGLSYPPDPWQSENAEQSILKRSGSSAGYIIPQSPVAPIVPNWSVTTPSERSPSGSEVHLPSIEIDGFPPLVARLLSFAYSVIVPTTWPNEDGKSIWDHEISKAWDDFNLIREDSCYASATLCFFATIMASAKKDADLASQAVFFQTQAMGELRQRVNDQAGGLKTPTLKAILRLFSAETALDNTSTARVHLKILRSVISAKGGVILLDSWFRENLLSADCYFALKYETRSLFPASEWTPGPLNQLWKTRMAASKVFDDHSSSVDSSIHSDVRSIILDMRELFRVEKYLKTRNVDPEDQLLRWRQLRKYDCISRLADHQLSVKIYPHLYERPKLQLATCFGISLMAAMVLGSPEPVRFGLKLLSCLKTSLVDARTELTEDTQPYERSSPRSTIFWLLFVGSMGEQVHPMPESSRWYHSEFSTMAEQLGLQTEQEQQLLLKQYLWFPRLVHEIHNQRAFRYTEEWKGVYEACGMSWRLPLNMTEESLEAEEQTMTVKQGKQVRQ